MDQKYYIQTTDQIPSPSLIVYLELVKDNIKQAQLNINYIIDDIFMYKNNSL